MTFSEDVLKNDELAMMRLRALYRRYGYTQYKMSKFEEYDLYVRNKSFLASDQIITFNDTSGKLMALKPDVTLSIVKNTKDSDVSLSKYYYNENIYRMSQSSREYKERMQVGLECIGSIDMYSMSEVIALAEMSLATISSRYVLAISHMGFLGALMDDAGLTAEQKKPVLKCISEKNAPEIEKLCARSGIGGDGTKRLMALASLYGPFEETVGTLREIGGEKTEAFITELEDVFRTVKGLGAGQNIHLDFSIVNDMNYYNSIIFQGYVDGIPTGILSGGRYDNLMARFGKKSGAIGYAVYIDLLERFETRTRDYDVDVLLLYDDTAAPDALARTVRALTESGKSVRAEKGENAVDSAPGSIKCRHLVSMRNGRIDGFESLY